MQLPPQIKNKQKLKSGSVWKCLVLNRVIHESDATIIDVSCVPVCFLHLTPLPRSDLVYWTSCISQLHTFTWIIKFSRADLQVVNITHSFSLYSPPTGANSHEVYFSFDEISHSSVVISPP